MNVVYTVSRSAEQDLLDIWEYIAEENVAAANQLLDLFEERFKGIAQRPGIGVLREEIGAGLRSVPVGNYLILYSGDLGDVSIVRVVHAARDIGSLL